MLRNYFAGQTARLEANCLSNISSLKDWTGQREQRRAELQEMLGLEPWPERSDLKAVVTGAIDHPLCRVEKIHFQSQPGLYVTANLYLPKNISRPVPAILYLCGHGPVIEEGISYGNKVTYQHHGSWFARHGYACLIVDSLQLGEIQGLHHGTYREAMWWWNSRGYTPAGVEAWNAIRALDYLQSRPEVDGQRLGVTGRSGGGAYTWWVAALDDRVKAAAPVAGITDLRNHVVDGTVEGHCDCMFMVNTYRWDFPLVAALVAPRPLMIANSDSDSIFPLDGVVRLHEKVRKIYDLFQAPDRLALVITPGPHKDTQELQLPVLRWFNRHLRNEEPLIETAAQKLFTPRELKVFEQLPADARNSRIQEEFVRAAPTPEVPSSAEAWRRLRDKWLSGLREKCFRAWPAAGASLQLKSRPIQTAPTLELQVCEFSSEPGVTLDLYLLRRRGNKPSGVLLQCLGESDAPRLLSILASLFPGAFGAELHSTGGTKVDSEDFAAEVPPNLLLAYFAPRGSGSSAWGGSEKKTVQIRRRFMLLGETADGMRVWDIGRAVAAVRSLEGLDKLPLSLGAKGAMAANVLYASLFEKNIDELILSGLPATAAEGPDYLNVARVVGWPEALAMGLEKSDLTVYRSSPASFEFAKAVRNGLHWPRQLRLEP